MKHIRGEVDNWVAKTRSQAGHLIVPMVLDSIWQPIGRRLKDHVMVWRQVVYLAEYQAREDLDR